MTLREALAIINQPADSSESTERLFLVCGFTPLHVQTFLAGHARQRLSGRPVEVLTGLFDDLPATLERAARARLAAAIVIEWPDLDPRLGIRHAGGWRTAVLDDAVAAAEARLQRLEPLVAAVAASAPVALCGPTLPLPPIAHPSGAQASGIEVTLTGLMAAFLTRCSAIAGVRLVNARRLDETSPPAERFDPRMTLFAGFPYRQPHADAMARALIDLLYPPAPKKGLILDLDNTLWRGIVGDVGIEQVHWDLEHKAQVHGLLQQMVAALAETGVLVGVASKNDPDVAAEALRRSDLLVEASALFPVEVSWGPKSAAVGRILRAWNVAADAVVFLDDSPMEIAEVQSGHPAIECLQFTPEDPDRVWALLRRLKDLFGKPAVTAEDQLRLGSVRAAADLHTARQGGEAPAEFVAGLDATVTLDYRLDLDDRRSFELVNKTNQFNLNGRRYTEADWRAVLERPRAFLVRVSYQDKFGPLGKIATLFGTTNGGTVQVDGWVMSCRAFSRRIEHHTLDRLFAHFGASAVRLNYTRTDRNMPLQEFLGALTREPVPADLLIAAEEFRQTCRALPHKVIEIHG